MSATVVTRHHFTATALIHENGLIEGHEKSFLAHLMSGRTACDKFLNRVSSEVLAVPHHRVIVDAIRDVYDERDEINHVTVSNRLNEKGKLAECGRIAGVIEIALSTTSAEIAESALTCMLEAYRAREAVKISKQLVAGEIALEQAAKGLTELSAHASEAQRPLIEFHSPLQLRNFTPPPGIVLVGDCHIVRGSVFVIGGAPGVGKSRAAVALAEAGATGNGWFGLTVHRRFKTMIIQAENGLFRLSKEFTELDCDRLEAFVRVSPPPQFGICFGREDFRAQLSAAIQEFQPDVIIFDPDRIDDVETLDKIGRRTFGISDVKEDPTHWAVNIAILNT
jgi:DnaB-like helicase N terminal domain/AAA domain